MASPLTARGRRVRTRPRLSEVEEDVRRHVARELHDRVAQTLTGMLVDLENFKAEPVAWDDVLDQMDRIQDSTRLVLHSLRQLLHDLRGEETVGDSFVDAVGDLATRFEQKTHISAHVAVLPGWPETLTPPASLNLYRIIEEALANVRMHSGARVVRIVLEPSSERELSIIIGDDGRGVDIHAERRLGMGTIGMKERAVIMGGQLHIVSELGDGTTVRAIFPKDLVTPQAL